jgi:hypothetical protein
MNPVKKAKWIAALVSGKYEQGRKTLKMGPADGPRHCCLGVLCDINKVKDFEDLQFPLVKDRKKLGFELSAADKRYLNVNCEDDDYPVFTTLSEYNDTGKSFTWIARYIKRYL